MCWPISRAYNNYGGGWSNPASITMSKIKLRISDCRQYAVEFEVGGFIEFVAALNDALIEYGEYHLSWCGGIPEHQTINRSRYVVPRPHLHVESAGDFVDVGYGRGTYTVLFTSITKNRHALAAIWDRAVNSKYAADEMNIMLGRMCEFVTNDGFENKPKPKFTVIDGGNNE